MLCYGEINQKSAFLRTISQCNGDLFAEAQISLLVIKDCEVDVRLSKKLVT